MSRKMLLGGRWRAGSENFKVKSPFTNELIAEVSAANAEEAEEAIAAADEASKKIRKLSRFELANGLQKISDGIEKRKKELTQSIIDESAKPFIYAAGEVERAIATFHHAAVEAERFCGEVIPVDAQAQGKNKTARTLKIPKGVIYGITPFNFPLNLVAHKVAPALAVGNSIIIKPSEKTPITSLLVGEIFLESGLPESALQILPMDVRHIETVLKDERVKMISFTGSAEIGWKLKSQVGKKAIALELGGNAPVIIDKSANIKNSVAKNVVGAFAYSGQVCISVQRIFIHEEIFDDWTKSFIDDAKKLKKGNPAEKSTQISVMINEKAAKKARGWITEAEKGSAKKLCGGNVEGAMMDATVLTNTDPEMRVVWEEIFAPVAVVEKFSDFPEAVEMANHSKYGLQAGVFTNDLFNADFAAENLEFGGVIINDVPTFRVDNMPYGGLKESGFGREGIRWAMDEMSDVKIVVSDFSFDY